MRRLLYLLKYIQSEASKSNIGHTLNMDVAEIEVRHLLFLYRIKPKIFLIRRTKAMELYYHYLHEQPECIEEALEKNREMKFSKKDKVRINKGLELLRKAENLRLIKITEQKVLCNFSENKYGDTKLVSLTSKGEDFTSSFYMINETLKEYGPIISFIFGVVTSGILLTITGALKYIWYFFANNFT